MTTSFFGLHTAPDNPLRKASLLHWLAKKKVAFHDLAKDETYHECTTKYPDTLVIEEANEFISLATAYDARGKKIYERENKIFR